MPYTFQTVTVPGATGDVRANGINNAGEIVGSYVNYKGPPDNPYPQTFIDTNGTISTVPLAFPGNEIGSGINSAGQIVGSYGNNKSGENAFLWSPDGSSQDVVMHSTGGAGPIIQAFGINDAGQIVGGFSPSQGAPPSAFVSQNGTNSFFQAPGASSTEAHGINNNGTIVGTAGSHGFIDVGGQFSPIDVPGATITDPMGINNDGTIVGSYNDGTHWHGFIDVGGKMTFIDAPGAADTWVTGENDLGTLVGYTDTAPGGTTQGFIATEDPPTTPPPATGDPPASPPPVSVFDTSTQSQVSASATPYSGPVAGLQNQYINNSSDGLNVTASTRGWFIHTGSGTDAIAVSGGTNVLDGGTGSNFLTGGTGTDTFFVDDRSASADIWSTVVGFHQGDAATIWGVTPQDFNLAWADGQGAAGYTGLTLHATKPSAPTASLTLAGYSQADIASGRLTVQFGTDTASGSSYMYIHA